MARTTHSCPRGPRAGPGEHEDRRGTGPTRFFPRVPGLTAWALALVVIPAGCGETPEPTTITVTPASATLQSLGETVQLTATVEDQDGETMRNVMITWTSRDTRAATVDGNGLVTAAGNGTATMEAAAGAAVGAAEVTVAQRPAEVAVSPLVDTLVALDDTVRLTAEAFDANGHTVSDAEFTWSSGDESVVTVDAAGLVTAVANGAASVQASIGTATSRGLHLWSNGLTGPIPPELGDLQNLEELGLWGNGLTGSIPPGTGPFPTRRSPGSPDCTRSPSAQPQNPHPSGCTSRKEGARLVPP